MCLKDITYFTFGRSIVINEDKDRMNPLGANERKDPVNVARVKFNVDCHRGGIFCARKLYAIAWSYASSKAIDNIITLYCRPSQRSA